MFWTKFTDQLVVAVMAVVLMRMTAVMVAVGMTAVRLMATTAGTGTFTYTRFHIPRAPTAPAMAPAARARPGGLGVKLAGPE